MSKRKENILFVDNDRDIRKLVRNCLGKEGYDLAEAENGKAALEKAEGEKPDLILLDVMMPAMNGFEVCREIRQIPRLSTIYIIMLTARADSKSKVTGLDYGADDYITKPFDCSELRARVRTGLRTARATNGAITDALTRLYNRQFFNIWLTREVERAKRFHHPLSLVMLDMDYFKRVNDTFGHGIGDTVLVELAEILRGHSRQTDMAVRWGGEEFILVLPETDIGGALLKAEKIRITVKKHNFTQVGSLSASFGVAELGDGDKDDLLKKVDMALFEAKGNGRDQVKVV